MKHSEITKNDIKVLGRVVSITSNNTVASSEQIWDDKFNLENAFVEGANDSGNGASQYDINRKFAKAIANGGGGGNPNLTLNQVIANSGLGTPEAGDILYFNGTSWELKPITSLVYWTISNDQLTPDLSATHNVKDIYTPGSIYSGTDQVS